MGWTVRGSNPDGARFSAPVQNGPGAHPATYKISTGSFPELRRPGRGVDHPPPSSAKKSTAILLPPLWTFMACSRVNYYNTILFSYGSTFFSGGSCNEMYLTSIQDLFRILEYFFCKSYVTFRLFCEVNLKHREILLLYGKVSGL